MISLHELFIPADQRFIQRASNKIKQNETKQTISPNENKRTMMQAQTARSSVSMENADQLVRQKSAEVVNSDRRKLGEISFNAQAPGEPQSSKALLYELYGTAPTVVTG